MKRTLDKIVRTLLLIVTISVAFDITTDKRPAPYRTGRGSAHEQLDKA